MRQKMKQETWQLEGIVITVERKRIKHCRLRVLPPAGEVRLSIPQQLSDEVVWAWLRQKLSWLQKQKAHFQQQLVLPPRQYETGELQPIWGKWYPLQCLPQKSGCAVVWQEETLQLYCAADSNLAKKQAALEQFYRQQLQQKAAPYLAYWQEQLQVTVKEWRLKKMHTRWGTCNIQAARIWLSLQLAYYPETALEYVIVHELCHLLEANHSKVFWQLVADCLSDWQERRQQLAAFSILTNKK